MEDFPSGGEQALNWRRRWTASQVRKIVLEIRSGRNQEELLDLFGVAGARGSDDTGGKQDRFLHSLPAEPNLRFQWVPDLRGLNMALLEEAARSLAPLHGVSGIVGEAKLAHARLEGADLSYTRLGGADLRMSYMQWCILEGTDLASANLSYADLENSRLTGVHAEAACLIGASLESAKVHKSDFHKADLSDTVLDLADFQEVDLAEARLGGARFHETQFKKCNLVGANLLDACLRGILLDDDTKFVNGRNWLGRVSLESERVARKFDVLGGDPGPTRNSATKQWRMRRAAGVYRQLKEAYRAQGLSDKAGEMYYSERCCMRCAGALGVAGRLLRAGEWFIMDFLCGYGEKPIRVLLASVFMIVLAASLYNLCFPNAIVYNGGAKLEEPTGDGNEPTLLCETGSSLSFRRWGRALYISTATFTTLGFGEWHPHPGSFVM